MAIARGQSASSASGAQQTTPLTLVIPAGVAVGSCLWFMGGISLGSAGLPTMTVTSTGSSLTQVDTQSHGGTGSTSNIYVITSTTLADQGATISLTPSGNAFIGMSLATYTGASATQPDVETGSVQSTPGTTFTAPSTVTTIDNDWAVYFASFLGGGSISGTPGTSVTQDVASRTSIADSNGGVGLSGTTIGGGTWTGTASVPWIGFTLGMAPLGGTVAGAVAPLALAAPAGSIGIGIQGPVSPLALAAPAGTVQSTAVTIAGQVAQLFLAAPAGSTGLARRNPPGMLPFSGPPYAGMPFTGPPYARFPFRKNS